MSLFSGKNKKNQKKKKSSNTVIISGPALSTTKAAEEPVSKRQVVELCEEMIDVSRELEDIRSEYQMVTSYLNDVQIISELPEEEKAAIQKSASMVYKLDHTRTQFLESEQKLSDVQFAQMQEEEYEIPAAMKRLKSNEAYLDAIKRDLNYLEGEKVEWEILKQEYAKEQRIIRRTSFIFFLLFAGVVVLLLLMSFVLDMDTRILMSVVAFLAVLFGAFSLLKYQNNSREIHRCDVNRNQAVTLENHVKIKYVNIKNAVDYACEKYHIKNSYELTYLFEQYQEAVKEREKFRQTNDDLQYYSEQLVRQLEAHKLYDARAWIHYVNALLDAKEMVELKHDLLMRRKKLRSRMEYNVSVLSDIKKEIEQYVKENRQSSGQIEQILSRIEEISQLASN